MVAAIDDTVFDLRSPTRLDRALEQFGGYDHNFVLDGKANELRAVAWVSEPSSGRNLELCTDQPGCQLYTGNGLDGSLPGKGGAVYRRHQGLCLETQRPPNAIHHPGWPTPVLQPGATYRHRMECRFTVTP